MQRAGARLPGRGSLGPAPSVLDAGPSTTIPVTNPDEFWGETIIPTVARNDPRLIMAHASIYEYYGAETGQLPATAADTFGWTAAVFIDLAIQASQEGSSG